MEQNISSGRFLAQWLLNMQKHDLGSWSVLL